MFKCILCTECDFVVQRGIRVDELIQVCWTLNDDSIGREVDGLLAAHSATGCNLCRIITLSQQQTIEWDGVKIEVLPIWGLIGNKFKST